MSTLFSKSSSESVNPLYSRLNLIPNFQRTIIDGTVEISLKPIEETFEIIFNVHDLRIDRNYTAIRKAITNSSVGIYEQEYISSERYKVVTKESLKKGEIYILDLKYDTDFNSHLLGIYNSRYFDSRSRKTK